MRFWEKESYYFTLFFGIAVQPAYFWESQNQCYAIAAENYHEYSSAIWIIPFSVKKSDKKFSSNYYWMCGNKMLGFSENEVELLRAWHFSF